jgi:hypothetical protein
MCQHLLATGGTGVMAAGDFDTHGESPLFAAVKVRIIPTSLTPNPERRTLHSTLYTLHSTPESYLICRFHSTAFP